MSYILESDEPKKITIYNAHGQIIMKRDNFRLKRLKFPLNKKEYTF